jgi:hypothetical protein
MRIDRNFARIAQVCSFLAPMALLTADLCQTAERRFAFSVWLFAAAVCFVPAILAVAYRAGASSPALATLGGGLAFFGAMAMAGMSVLFRAQAVLLEMGQADTVTMLGSVFKLAASTQMIGIAFPAGLLLLALTLWRGRMARPWGAILLAGGAIAFPIGHAAGVWVFLIAGDLLLLAAFALLGRRIVKP